MYIFRKWDKKEILPTEPVKRLGTTIKCIVSMPSRSKCHTPLKSTPIDNVKD